MARIAGVDLPLNKRVEVGLTYIFGIGRSRSNDILTKATVNRDTRVKDLTEDDVRKIRQIITDETMLRYGAMQIDVFSLLTEARQRVAVNIAGIEAQRNFWLANTNLDAALVGGGVAASGGAAPRMAAGAPGVSASE